MKKTLTCLFLLITTTLLLAQSDGIRYHAFIEDPNIKEVPGPNIVGAALSNEIVEIRFTITDKSNNIEYQETQTTVTDNKGMIDLIIGKGSTIQGVFTEIKWYGKSKTLKVAVNISHQGFKELSKQELLFTPFAYHRDIYAKGFLEVDKKSTFKDNATFNKNVTINENLQVDKNSTFKDDATFNKNVTINEDLQVNQKSTFRDNATLYKNATINENLQVDKNSTFKDDATFNKNVTINENLQVDKKSTFKDDATFNKNVTINENLQVDKNSTFKDDATFNKNITINGSLQVGKNSTFKDDATFNKNVTINENLQVDKKSTFKDNTTFNKNVTINGSLQVDKNSTFKNHAIFNKDITINKNLFVNKNSTYKDSVTFEKQSKFERNISIKGKTVFNSKAFKNKDNSETGSGKGDEDIKNYPVLIEGSKQGLAIKVTPLNTNPIKSNRGNNYISFWNDNIQTGRIEGMGKGDLLLKPTKLINTIYDIMLEAFKTEVPRVFNPLKLAELSLNHYKSFMLFEIGKLPRFNLGDIRRVIDFDAGKLPVITFPKIKIRVEVGIPPKIEFKIKTEMKIDFSGVSLPSLYFNNAHFPRIESFGELPKFNFKAPNLPDFTDPFAICPIQFSIANRTQKSLKQNIDNRIESELKSNVYSKGNPLLSSEPEYNSVISSNHYSDQISFVFDIVKQMVSLVKSIKASKLNPGEIPKKLWTLGCTLSSFNLYQHYVVKNIGSSFESGSGDYAEWLIRAKENELITAGDVVGVIGGKISKSFNHADRFMVVSTAPIILGNMPNNPDQTHKWEKVAFMGQVPVKIIGRANIGDYILPSGNGDGMAIAINPEKMTASDYKRIIGVAWENTNTPSLFNMINVAVGIHRNNTSKMIEQMQITLNHIQKTLVKLDPNYETHEYFVKNNKFKKQTKNYSVAISHSSQLGRQYKNNNFSDKNIKQIKQDLLIQGLDVDQYPLIKLILDNPDKTDRIYSALQHISSKLNQYIQ